jgi:hypothetical protein
MYLRTVKASNSEYVQLCHNYRIGGSGPSKTKVLYSFGRKDELDLDSLKRLVRSVGRYLEPDEAQQLFEEIGLEIPFEFLGAKELGGTHLLDGIWKRLGLNTAFKRLLKDRNYTTPIERLIFALVANRALAPGSKLSLESWTRDQAYIDGLPEVDVQQLYRAMDFLLEEHDEVQREVFWQVSNLFNLEVDVIFVDTTTTYFEIPGEDPDFETPWRDNDQEDDRGSDKPERELGGLRKRGHSKDSRADLAQVVIGFAVTREGLPVRCWVWPGNRVDVKLVDEVKRDLNSWKLGRVIMVMDTGFNSEDNRRILQGAGDAFILGEKLRLGPKGKLPEALKRAGRYKTLTGGLRIKEVTTNADSVMSRRFVVVHNPERAMYEQFKREDIVSETERRLAEIKELDGEQHTKAVCALVAHRTFGRYIRQTKTGKLRLDKAKIQADAKLDGKFLVSTSDLELSAEDIALGYKQLYEIERINKDLKHTVDIRPVYHRKGERIKAHVLLCWLALLLIRIAENESGETWHQIKKNFRPLLVGFHSTRHGLISETSPVKAEQKRVLDALSIKPPRRYLELPTPN